MENIQNNNLVMVDIDWKLESFHCLLKTGDTLWKRKNEKYCEFGKCLECEMLKQVLFYTKLITENTKQSQTHTNI